MGITVGLVRYALALVFGAAGIGKALDRDGRKAVEDFGVPGPLAGPVSVLLPLLELAAAVFLLVPGLAWWGAAAALALLVAFTIAITANLARGKRPDCHCFGQLHSARVGWTTVLRNLILAAGAVFVLTPGAAAAGAGNAELVALLASPFFALALSIVSFVGLAAGGWLLLNLMRQNGRLLLRMDELEERLDAAGVRRRLPGLPLGSPAPSFELPDVSGKKQSLKELTDRKKPAMLVFADTDCSSCRELLPEIAKWQQQHEDVLSFALITPSGSVSANSDMAAIRTVLFQNEREVAESYLASTTPSAVVVDSDGTIASPVVSGKDAIYHLVAQITESPEPEGGLPVGETAPDFTLPDLDGVERSLSDYRGRKVLAIFFSPYCGYCHRMAPDLAKLDPEGAVVPLLITAGSPEDNRKLAEEHGIQCHILLQGETRIAAEYQTSGTPTGYLLDEEGRIASGLAVGGQALLKLAAAHRNLRTEQSATS